MTDSSKPILVAGIGNDYRSDDGAGLEAVRRIRGMNINNVKTLEGVSDGTSLIEYFANRKFVFIIDAANSNAAGGVIHRFDALKDAVPVEMLTNFSTHSINIGQAIELAKALKQLPDSLIVFGIEGNNFENGAELSPEVVQAVDNVVELIKLEIEAYDRCE
ncbi:MAG: hydrogenase maturation protease [candidate division Zixibacteria bacterium]|nr:hydrogenase maturation protease [candidate division Zixibacteria bacterium]